VVEPPHIAENHSRENAPLNFCPCDHHTGHSGTDGCIQWAAFYSDCLHEVEKVTSGCRVTIAYSMIVRKGHPSTQTIIGQPAYSRSDRLTHAAWPSTSEADLGKITASLDQLRSRKHDPRDAVGIYLSHMYTHAGLCPSGMRPHAYLHVFHK
jgi:hypothetical protein